MFRAEDNVHDLLAYLLQSHSVSKWQAHKLLYYVQGWHLAWTEYPAFNEIIRADATGPVIVELLELFSDLQIINSWSRGDSSKLSAAVKETANDVLTDYANLTSQQLTDLAKSEAPWKIARRGLAYDVIQGEVISKPLLRDFYSALNADPTAAPVATVF